MLAESEYKDHFVCEVTVNIKHVESENLNLTALASALIQSAQICLSLSN